MIKTPDGFPWALRGYEGILSGLDGGAMVVAADEIDGDGRSFLVENLAANTLDAVASAEDADRYQLPEALEMAAEARRLSTFGPGRLVWPVPADAAMPAPGRISRGLRRRGLLRGDGGIDPIAAAAVLDGDLDAEGVCLLAVLLRAGLFLPWGLFNAVGTEEGRRLARVLGDYEGCLMRVSFRSNPPLGETAAARWASSVLNGRGPGGPCDQDVRGDLVLVR